MDVQLKELLETIKKDGVDQADKKAAEIIAEAEKKAASIVAEAEKRAQDLKNAAEKEADNFKQTSDAAIKQAGRDLIITLKGKVEELFSNLLTREIQGAMDNELLKSAITTLVKSWKEGEDLSVLLNEKDQQALASYFQDKLAAEMQKGLEIKPFRNLEAGFRVSQKDGGAFYDFSDKEITQVLARFLNPRIAELLNG